MALLEPGYRRKALTGQLLYFLSWVAVSGIGLYLHPDPSGHGTHRQLGLPSCPSVLLFDRPCPGCGLTTSWTALLHGQFGLAFHVHPLGPPLYILYTVSAGYAIVGWFKLMRFATDSRPFNRIMAVTIVCFLTFGFIRMAVTPHYGTIDDHEVYGLRVDLD